MTEFKVEVAKIAEIAAHPNADRLEIATVFDYRVIVKKGDYSPGELVVYIPIDSIVPDTQEWHFLAPRDESGSPRYPVGSVPAKYRTIEPKRLRGIFSQGILSKLPPGEWKVGDDLCAHLQIKKHDDDVELTTRCDQEAFPVGWKFPIYTDVEGIRRNPGILIDGEEVVIHEKIHGANGRYVHDGERLWVGSHTQIKRDSANNVWWRAAKNANLAEKLAKHPWYVFYGEVYGRVQKLQYGLSNDVKFVAFDVYDMKNYRYLDYDDATKLALSLEIDWVPLLYKGPWSESLNALADGNSAFAEHIREGFVVKPTKERWDERVGRVILKRHGEEYLLLKKKRA